jgi:N-acetyl-anhydromuramyl-L-alanine amidase AmpD
MADYQGAIELLNNNCFPNRNGIKPTFLIIHGTAGGSSAQEIAQYFKGTEGGANPVSAHYVVDQEGIVYQCNLESTAAWANGPISGTPTPNLPFRAVGDEVHRDDWWNPNVNPNYQTISIEHVKPDDENVTALTPAQQAASFALIKDICQRNGIPMRFANSAGGITGHFSMDVAERSFCPNTYPWDALWAYLANGGTMTQVPTGWTDDGSTLKGPNGIPVTLGFRDHVLTSNWSPDNWPLEEVQHLGLIEQSNPGLGAGQSQIFRWKTLEYTPKMGVFEAWVGQELQWYVKQYAQLQAQVTTLQGENATLKALPIVSTLNQINTLGQQIIKLSQVQ